MGELGHNVDVMEWLTDSDPAIRWQTMRDLTEVGREAIAKERARVTREGLGAEILARQEEDGSWRRDGAPKWLSTLFTLQLLRSMGADPAERAVGAAMTRAEASLRWNDNGGCWDVRPAETGGNAFFEGEEEPCINGGVLACGSYFGRPSEKLARQLVSEQQEDGGWNCEAPGSRRSSFHTTICVLEGLLEYEHAVGEAPAVVAARRRGEEYLLKRGLMRRLSNGELVNAEFLELAFPPRYHYDVLRALDYFRAAGDEPDARMLEAVGVIESKRQADRRWLLDRAYETAAMDAGETVGEPSRWNTLRALRVQRWWGEGS